MASGIRRFDAIVLAGGRGSRLGGIDKPALRVGGRTLLAHALDAVAGARRISVVRHADDVPVSRQISRTVENPQWSGPAAAIAAGLEDLGRRPTLRSAPEFVVVVASDLPGARAAVDSLLLGTLAPEFDGLMAVDPDGRDQPLLAVYRREPLRAAVAAHDVVGLGVSRLIAGLAINRVRLLAGLCADIDDADDARAAGIELEHRVAV